jgi:hypothetical protein
MPRNVAQWTGVAIATIVVLGRDSDVVYALPLSLAAGGLAAFFAALPDLQASIWALGRARRDRI